MNGLYKEWILLKEVEKNATENRRKIEDELIKQLHVPETIDETLHYEREGFDIKVVGRLNRKVDTEKLQELAAQAGLSEHLSSLFRWSCEINSAVWKASDDALTKPLLGAITTKPARPSFTITFKE